MKIRRSGDEHRTLPAWLEIGADSIPGGASGAAIGTIAPANQAAKVHAQLSQWGFFPMVFAYIDPGAGSMVIQAVIAGALAIPFFFRTQVARLFARIRGRGEHADSGRED